MNVCIIPARGGSRRIPKKNIQLFHGKPIITYSIETAKESGLFNLIIVSTDSQEIAEIAHSHGTDLHIRTDEMAKDEIGTQEVMKNVLDDAKITSGAACCIYPTAPLMSVNDLIRGSEALCYGSLLFDYAFSVGTNPLSDAGQFYWGKVTAFLHDAPLIGENTAMIPISDDRVCDINTPDDFHRAEEMYKVLIT